MLKLLKKKNTFSLLKLIFLFTNQQIHSSSAPVTACRHTALLPYISSSLYPPDLTSPQPRFQSATRSFKKTSDLSSLPAFLLMGFISCSSLLYANMRNPSFRTCPNLSKPCEGGRGKILKYHFCLHFFLKEALFISLNIEHM
mgnify:FL=1